MHPTDHVKVKGKVSDIPDTIEVDISGLAMHESITAAHITLPEGVELISNHDTQLFSVTMPAKVEDMEAGEAEGTESVEVPTVAETEATEE